MRACPDVLRAGRRVHPHARGGSQTNGNSRGSQLFGGIALLPFVVVFPPAVSSIDARIALIVVVFALVCSGVAYLIYYRLIADIGPTKALTVTFLIPVFAMMWGFLLLHEAVTWSMIVGAVIILVGTFLVAAGGAPKTSAGTLPPAGFQRKEERVY